MKGRGTSVLQDRFRRPPIAREGISLASNDAGPPLQHRCALPGAQSKLDKRLPSAETCHPFPTPEKRLLDNSAGTEKLPLFPDYNRTTGAAKCAVRGLVGTNRQCCFKATTTSKPAGIITEMKLLTEYLERAVSLERLAANEQESQFKRELLHQAEAYRKLAAKRAADYGLPPPSPPEILN